MTTYTLPAGTSNIADAGIGAFLDKTDTKGWIVKAGDILEFPPASNATLVCDNGKNLIIKGTLKMRPSAASVVHYMDWRNIDETSWVSAQKKGCSLATVSGTTVTYTVSPNSFPGVTEHNFQVGDSFEASTGFAPANYRGTAVVSARTSTTISCVKATPPVGTATALGTIRATGVITKDTGLWVVAGGKLDIQGTTKLGWTRASTSIASGATSVVCDDTLTGWRDGDLVVIAPTGANQTEAHISAMTIATGGVSGNTVTFTAGVPRAHARIAIPANTRAGMVAPAKGYGAELVNLTRNVRLSGEALPGGDHTKGRLHIHFTEPTTTQTHTLKFAEMFNVGPPGARRSALCFQNVGSSAAGTVIEGVVARSGGTGSHTFQQNATNGITLKDCIAYNVDLAPYCWEIADSIAVPTSSMWDHCGALFVRDDAVGETMLAAFQMNPGATNRCTTLKDCFAACVQEAQFGCGFIRPQHSVGETGVGGWIVEGTNVAHNNVFGAFTWELTNINFASNEHPGFVFYRNYGAGIYAGAESASYRWDHATFYDNGTWLGVSGKNQNVLGGIYYWGTHAEDVNNFEGRHQYDYMDIGSKGPIGRFGQIINPGTSRLYDAEVVNATAPFFLFENQPGNSLFRWVDLVRVAITPTSGSRREVLSTDIAVNSVGAGSRVRVQSLDDQTAFQIDYPSTGDGSNRTITSIAPFATRVTTLSLPDATVNAAYPSQTLTAVANAPRTWSLVDGTTLPVGLTLSTAGVISGTPTVAGTKNFTVQVRDADGIDAPKALSITVASVVVPPSGLPPGLTLNTSTGAITGTPTLAGSYFPTFVVTDSAGASGPPKQLGITVLDAAPIITTPAVNDGEQGVAYTEHVDATGGQPPYTFSLILGPLPPGVSMSSAGVFSGTPTASGDYSVRLRVTDTQGHFSQRDYVMTMFTPFDIPDQILAQANEGQAYSETVEVLGGGAPFVFDRGPQGALPGLPGGLAMSAGGIISGVPTEEGTFTFTILAFDRFGASDSIDGNIIVNPALFVVADEISRNVQRSFAQRRPHGGSRMRDKVK